MCDYHVHEKIVLVTKDHDIGNDLWCVSEGMQVDDLGVRVPARQARGSEAQSESLRNFASGTPACARSR